MKRDSVVIFRNLFEALENVSEKSYKKIMNAVLKYSLDGEEVNLTGAEKAVFTLAKTQIDANNKRYEARRENGKKCAEYGKLGGRPKKNKSIIENEETFDDIISVFEFSSPVEEKVRAFIRYSFFNGHKLTNDMLNGILVQLDTKYEADDDKLRALDDAIKYNYYGLRS